MKFNNSYLDIKTKIQMLENWILVHCYLYYVLDISIVTDNVFDNNAKELSKLLNNYPKEAEKSIYWYAFKDYNPSTGYDLYDRLLHEEKDKITKMGNQLKYLMDHGIINKI